MFNDITHMQADNSTFNSVGRDQYNAGHDLYNTQFNFSIVPDQQPQQLAQWISPLNFNEQQDVAFGNRTQGTGSWLLQSPEFKGWMDDKYRVLWCPGKPGVGKTILTSIVISHLRELFTTDDDSAVVFIYCAYKVQHNVLQLLEALLKQLAFRRLTSNSIELLQRQYKDRGCRPSLDTLTTILKTEIETYSHVFILVDALDECFPEHVREDLLEKLQSLAAIHPAKLMVTSRYIPSIERAIRADIKLEIIASESDIKSHVEARILKNDMLKRLITKAPSMEEKVIRKVVEKAGGMFLLARLHMDSLADESNRNAIIKALERLPEGLEGTYDDAMERINQQSEKRKHMAYRLLSWISSAFRPLSLIELRYALAVREDMTEIDENDLDDEEFLISVCAGLVTVSEGSSRVGLVHYTTQEYLQGVRHKGGLFLSPADLAISCLAHLSFDGVHISSKNPFLEYAALGWGVHSRGFDDCPNVMKYAVGLLCDDARLNLVGNIVLPYRWCDRGASGLHLCAFFGLKHIAERLLENGHNPSLGDCEGQVPLHYAARYGHQLIAKLLLETGGVDVNTLDKRERTPFSWAAMNGHDGVVKLLLETGKVEVDAGDVVERTPLFWAAENGHDGVVKLLLETGKVEVDAEDVGGRTPLCRAAENGHDGVVKLLLATGKADINARDKEYRQRPLYWAAENGHEGVVKLLLETGMVDVNAKDDHKWTPLFLAVKKGHEAVVKKLLETGKVEVDLEDEGERTPLSYAAENGHDGVVKLLLTTGMVDVDTRDKEYSRTPLSWAAEKGHEGVVKLLLETGKVDVDAKDKNEWTPLFWAAVKGHEAVVKLLVEIGKVDVDVRDGDERTTLSWASEKGNEAVVKLLLETGKVDIDAKDQRYSQTPLSWAAEKGHEGVVKLLLDTGKVDIDAKDKWEQSPLLWAAMKGHEAVVGKLLETGKADVDVRDVDGLTPLSWASEKGREGVVKLLLETGKVDVNAKDNRERTPLFWGAVRGHEAVVKLLLETRNLDIDARDQKYSQTPLSWAAENGHEGVVKLLLETGTVDIDARDQKYSRTPLSWAIENGHGRVAKLLLDAGKVSM